MEEYQQIILITLAGILFVSASVFTIWVLVDTDRENKKTERRIEETGFKTHEEKIAYDLGYARGIVNGKIK